MAVEILLRKNARVDLVGRDGSALEQAKRVLDDETFRKIEELVGRMVRPCLIEGARLLMWAWIVVRANNAIDCEL